MTNDIINILMETTRFPPECIKCLEFCSEAIKSVPCNGDWFEGCENRTDYVEKEEEDDE